MPTYSYNSMEFIHNGYMSKSLCNQLNCLWVISLNLVQAGYLQLLAILHNLTANGHGCFGQN